MSLLKSLAYSLKAARFNPLTIIHAACYAATVTYLRVLRLVASLDSQLINNHIRETYHGKVIRQADARKIINIDRNIELRGLDQLLPYRRAKDLILLNPHNITVYDCPCRGQKDNPCRPVDVCLIVGEPFADLVRMLQPFRSRRITREEALDILREEDARGHIHTAWFKSTMLDRFYAICNCCRCCCLGMKFMNEYGVKMLLPSGYRAVVSDGCIGCGSCLEYCQFGAMEITTSMENGRQQKKCAVIAARCFGCGVCENKCPKNRLTLVLDPDKGIPLDIEKLAAATISA